MSTNATTTTTSSSSTSSSNNNNSKNEQQQQQQPQKEPKDRFSSTNKSARSGGRKISLPWFRQNSFNASALSRQHTIDSPGSYRYVKQISENNAKVIQ